jgi:hypothetical protein
MRRHSTKPHYQSCQVAPSQLVAVAKLPDLAEAIEKFRFMRNDLVHRIATERGQQQRALVNEPPLKVTEDTDWEPTDEMLRELTEQAASEHRERISTPMRWYRLLVEASNHVFIIENMLRL